MAFESLDFIYHPSRDVKRDVAVKGGTPILVYGVRNLSNPVSGRAAYRALRAHAAGGSQDVRGTARVLDELEASADVDATTDAAVHGTPGRVMLVSSLRSLALLRRAAFQRVTDSNPLDDEHAILDFDVPLGFRGQVSLTGVDLARLQRATQGPGESAGSRGDDVVERGGVRLEASGGRLVMLGHFIVNAKEHRLALFRKVGSPQRTFHALDSHARDIADLAHANPIVG